MTAADSLARVRTRTAADPAVRARPARRGKSYAPVAAFASALSVMSVPLIGPLGVALFLICGGGLVLIDWRASLAAVKKHWFLFLFPLVAMLSAIWSDAPQQTMRTSLQLLLTFGASILIATYMGARGLVAALFVGAMAMCLSAIPNVPGAIQRGSPLASSLLGSKNQLGFAAYLLFACAAAIVIDRRQRAWLRVLAGLAIPFCLATEYFSRSGGGTVSILLTLLLFPAFAFLAAVKPGTRIVLSAAGLITFALALLSRDWIDEQISNFRTQVLEKDESLTGRTHLWDVADQLWQERPVLGHGYAAFWRHGNLDAEGLWRWGGIATRSGFNFHNVLVETKVDLGILGVVLVVALCGLVLLATMWRQVREPSIGGAFLISALLVLFVRSTIENGLIAQFSSLTLILLAAAVYSLAPAAWAAADAVVEPKRRASPRVGPMRSGGPGRGARR